MQLLFSTFLFLYIIIYLTIAFKNFTPSARLKCTGDNFCIINDDIIRFFLIGDIGGDPIYPYSSYAQRKVANAMNELCIEKKYTFVINTGDNIYFNGVEHIFDSRFDDTFEYVYDKDYLKMPFYMTFGNHDYLGNTKAQINYTYHSNKWTFPNYYYTINYHLKNETKIKFLMIDTIQLCGNTIDIDGSNIISWIKADHHDPSGPDDVNLANEQWEWIKNELENSSDNYLFVVGHYPVYSISEHGPTKCLIDKLDPLLRKYNVTAYFAGHDHNLQDLLVYDKESETYMSYIISGAGSKTDRSKKNKNKISDDSVRFFYPQNFNPFGQLGLSDGGFISVEVKNDQAVLIFYSGNESELHRMYLYPRFIN
ncbi:Tartrate-resistant acid phosphatase type 5 [Strongyloides ratti]|uniref:Tartrate-resistant acid phosphatase type 5 n=1 Tax=Strongyloides ratti TaxID=34506 RepID=A0A090LIC3_STRRB|nr:Tartrate-resistant acid phosphatase type 5 [Strongyloides ratti]CEF67893.1 Tartrate-resistant acid phosphatase type 5 [Strongyloides ratti]